MFYSEIHMHCTPKLSKLALAIVTHFSVTAAFAAPDDTPGRPERLLTNR